MHCAAQSSAAQDMQITHADWQLVLAQLQYGSCQQAKASTRIALMTTRPPVPFLHSPWFQALSHTEREQHLELYYQHQDVPTQMVRTKMCAKFSVGTCDRGETTNQATGGTMRLCIDELGFACMHAAIDKLSGSSVDAKPKSLKQKRTLQPSSEHRCCWRRWVPLRSHT